MSDLHENVENDDISQDPKQEKKQKRRSKKIKVERQRELEDIRVLAASEVGIRFMKRVIERSGFLQQPKGKYGPTDGDTNFACGELNISHWLIAEVSQAFAEFEEPIAQKYMGKLLFRKVGNEVDAVE